jgi:hypothetical protein
MHKIPPGFSLDKLNTARPTKQRNVIGELIRIRKMRSFSFILSSVGYLSTRNLTDRH